MMERAGGYRDWQALLAADPRDLEDLEIVLAGEAEAARLRELEARAAQNARSARA
jgi:hypothetical protein